MIEAIYLKGFQSHVDSYVPLAPGLSVIVGPTDSGKTAIIRAIRWVAFNEPAGEAFVNEAVGETEVTLVLASGVRIGKRRRKGKTAYEIAAPGNEPKVFDKAEVPEEVTKALGLARQSFGDFEAALNFSYQLDPPFLISEPPSAGAKVLGKLAGTEVVDLAIKSVSKDTHRYNADRLQAAKDIEKFEAKLTEYADLDGLKEQLAACEFLLGTIGKQMEQRGRLVTLNGQFGAAVRTVETLAVDLERLAIIPEIVNTLEQTEKAQQRYSLLLGHHGQLERLGNLLAGLQDQLTIYANLDAATASVAALDGSYSRYAILVNQLLVYTQKSAEVKRLLAVLDTTTQLGDAAEALTWLERADTLLERLYVLQLNYDGMTARVGLYTDLVAHLQPINQAAAILPAIDEKYARLRRLYDLRRLYQTKHTTVIDATQKLAFEENAVAVYQSELTAAWAGLEACPLCNQPIPEGGLCQ